MLLFLSQSLIHKVKRFLFSVIDFSVSLLFIFPISVLSGLVLYIVFDFRKMEDLPKDVNISSRQKPMAINLKYFDEDARNKIYEDLKRFDWEKIDDAFDEAKELYEEAANRTNSDLEQFPRSRTFRRVDYTEAELRHHRNTAYESIRKNEFCVVTLAGGQASRLGASVPKGIYPLDLGFENPYQNSLFYIQAAQIYRLQQLAGGSITWYDRFTYIRAHYFFQADHDQ